MRREDDDVDVAHSKPAICDGRTADLILAILLVSCTHPVLQSCSAAWLETLMIDLDDTGLVLDEAHPINFK